MTISRKLYVGFGSILGILVLLFLISFFTSQREHSARNTGASSLQTIQSIEKIRFQVMENGLNLRNYLLSGDPREEASESTGIRTLATLLREAQNKTTDDHLRETYSSIESNQQSWDEEFSKPLIAKRHQVDAGQTTVSDLQIVYLQRSANTWVEKSSKEMDEAERSIQEMNERIMLMGGIMVDRERALDAKTRREQAAAVLRSAIEGVQEIGCQVKDLDIGLVDFPTLFRGVEVYLCWKLGEPEIAFWHGVDEGFRGRKAIDQDFRDHHRGDRSQ